MCGVFFRVWGKGFFVGVEISFVSVVGAWSGTVLLVIHALILAMSRMGFPTLS